MLIYANKHNCKYPKKPLSTIQIGRYKLVMWTNRSCPPNHSVDNWVVRCNKSQCYLLIPSGRTGAGRVTANWFSSASVFWGTPFRHFFGQLFSYLLISTNILLQNWEWEGHSRFTYTLVCFSQNVFFKMFFSKCISQNEFLKYMKLPSLSLPSSWRLKIYFSKCISQNVFLKMYFSKCISKNVFLKMKDLDCFGLCSCWNWAKDQRTLPWKAVRAERLAWKVAKVKVVKTSQKTWKIFGD